MGLRKNKVTGLKQSMHGLFGVQLDAKPHKLTEDNVQQLLGDADLVVDCTDNAAARNLIQGFVQEQGIPCLHGAMSADGLFARMMWTEHFVLDAEGHEGEATCEDGENLPLHGLYGAILANVAQRFLVDGAKESYQATGTSIMRLT
jgi:hypothetical protein